jgi:hypothetical protein
MGGVSVVRNCDIHILYYSDMGLSICNSSGMDETTGLHSITFRCHFAYTSPPFTSDFATTA